MTARERVHETWSRIRALGRRRRLDAELDDELRFHLERRSEHYARAGLAPEAARLAAARRFGNVASLMEECREMWSFRSLETFVQDVRYALRVMARSPGFSAAAVLSLALGIGANAAIFSVVNAVLLRALPFPEPDRLVRPTGFYPKGAVAAMRGESRTLEIAGASSPQELNLSAGGEAVRLVGSSVSANLFAVLDRRPAVGRTFEAADEQPGSAPVVVLSHSLWQRRFGGEASVLGRLVTLDGVGRQVVGVMPAGFHFPSAETQLWLPLRFDSSRVDDYWGFGWMPLVARLRPGATLGQAQGELDALTRRVRGLFPWPSPTWNEGAAIVPLQDDLVRDVRRRVLVLQAAVGLVLLIACANVASLLLARAVARHREIALRAALGAGRARIVRQLLTESVVLSLLGGVLGVGVAVLLLSPLTGLVPAETRGFAPVGLDARVLAFATGLSVLAGLAFGLLPARGAARADLAGAIRPGGRGVTPGAPTRLRASLIAAEVALAVVLAVGAGLLARTLHGLLQADPGFRPEQAFAVSISPNPQACETRAACVELYAELVRRARGLPGVSEAAAASAVPLRGQQPLLPVELSGHPLVPDDPKAPLLWAGAVTPSYFAALRIPLVAGRGFDDRDGEDAERVVIVSAATAGRFWPGQSAIGRTIRVVWENDWRTVVGVAADVRHYALSGRAPEAIMGAMYLPYPQATALDRKLPRTMALVLRASGEPQALAPRLREVVAGVDPDVPVGEPLPLERAVRRSADEARAMSWLFAAFAATALLLAAIGTYGVVAYATAQRSSEIGVRMAVGASRGDIFALVIGQSLKLVLVGLAFGVAGALALGSTLEAFLYGVSPRDPLTFAVVIASLLLTALAAGYFPGRRAASTDPVRALRAD